MVSAEHPSTPEDRTSQLMASFSETARGVIRLSGGGPAAMRIADDRSFATCPEPRDSQPGIGGPRACYGSCSQDGMA